MYCRNQLQIDCGRESNLQSFDNKTIPYPVGHQDLTNIWSRLVVCFKTNMLIVGINDIVSPVVFHKEIPYLKV